MKRILSLLLALVLAFGCAAASAEAVAPAAPAAAPEGYIPVGETAALPCCSSRRPWP